MNYCNVFQGNTFRKMGWPKEGTTLGSWKQTIRDIFDLPVYARFKCTDNNNRELNTSELLDGKFSSVYILFEQIYQDEIEQRQSTSLFASITNARPVDNANSSSSLIYDAIEDSEETPLISRKPSRSGADTKLNRGRLANNDNKVGPFDSRKKRSPTISAEDGDGQLIEYEVDTKMSAARDFQGIDFQNQLLKFQRINAHLVNERTVLAWFRTNLAFVTLGVKFLNLGETYLTSEYRAAVVLCLCGGLFMLLLPISWRSGYYRYTNCKDMLNFNIDKLEGFLYKFGFDFDNASLGLVIFTSFIGIVFASWIIIWTDTAST